MTSATVPIFINDGLVQVPVGSAVGEALASYLSQLAPELDTTTAVITDARGLPVDPRSPVAPGAIFRIVRSARNSGANDE